MPRVVPAADVATLWLETLQRLVDRAAHEIKGALNGVALNVEVARSRSSRPGAEASAVAPYAAAAAQQLELLTAQTEAVLALARPARGRCDVGLLLGRLTDLATPIARASGGELRTSTAPDAGEAMVRAAPEVARLALGAAMLAVLEEPARGWIETRVGQVVLVVFRRDGGAPPRLPAEVAAVLVDAGVGVEEHANEIRLAFAASGADSGDQ